MKLSRRNRAKLLLAETARKSRRPPPVSKYALKRRRNGEYVDTSDIPEASAEWFARAERKEPRS